MSQQDWEELSFVRINMSFSAKINASSWLERPFKTIFSDVFCHIMCRDIFSSSVCLGSKSLKGATFAT